MSSIDTWGDRQTEPRSGQTEGHGHSTTLLHLPPGWGRHLEICQASLGQCDVFQQEGAVFAGHKWGVQKVDLESFRQGEVQSIADASMQQVFELHIQDFREIGGGTISLPPLRGLDVLPFLLEVGSSRSRFPQACKCTALQPRSLLMPSPLGRNVQIGVHTASTASSELAPTWFQLPSSPASLAFGQ